MKRIQTRTLRAFAVSAVVVLVLSGSLTQLGFGTLSSFGIGDLSLICPLGWLETLLASRSLAPRALIGLGLALLAIVLAGRAFCGWLCPIPFFRRWVAPRRARDEDQDPSPASAVAPEDEGPAHRTRYFVLGGALLSSAIFGFPVFCLVCPIGLFFGTLIGLGRLLRFNEPTLGLLLFPVVLIVEVVVLRKWCSRICPVGALIGLLARLNRAWRPKVDAGACLATSRGAQCLVCKRVCSEGIDPHLDGPSLASCTKCLDCADRCPAKAIRFPFFRGGRAAEPRPKLDEAELDGAWKTK